MVALICQQEARRGHRREELEKFRRGRCTQILQVRSNIVDYGKQGGVYCCKFALASCDDVVDRL